MLLLGAAIGVAGTLLSRDQSQARAMLSVQGSPVQPADLVRSSRSGLDAVQMGRKGRPKMPNQYATQQSMQQQQQAPQMPEDGTPIIYLYARSRQGNPWYPVSAMKGDGQTKTLVNGWMNAPFGRNVIRDTLDEGIAKSIFESERRLANLAAEQHRQLNDNKARLQWGFKIMDRDLVAKENAGEIEKRNIVAVNKSMVTKGNFLDRAKALVDRVGGNDQVEAK
jgi:hypothetical protein